MDKIYILSRSVANSYDALDDYQVLVAFINYPTEDQLKRFIDEKHLSDFLKWEYCCIDDADFNLDKVELIK